MTRDEARKRFADAGLKYSHLTRENLQRLRNLIDAEMRKSGCFNGTYRCKQRPIYRDGERFFAGVKCRAFYFDDREAVSFNRDDFIGFAGWSSDENVQPILAGFASWVEKMATVLGLAV
jgi:hypothetical protein